MIYILLETGKWYKGETCLDLVKALRDATWMVENNIRYMEGVAQRCRIWNGDVLQFNNEDEFVAELLRAGVIKEMVVKEEDTVNG